MIVWTRVIPLLKGFLAHYRALHPGCQDTLSVLLYQIAPPQLSWDQPVAPTDFLQCRNRVRAWVRLPQMQASQKWIEIYLCTEQS